jgi:dephospho-CoA kinase
MGTGNSSNSFSIGLTGGIGSGKSTVADMFAAHGATIIDTDLIAHQVTAPHGAAMEAIRAQFGDEYVLPSGAMDRRKMRELVFADPSAKIQLENILHPLIGAETEIAVARAQGCYLMFVVPLLVESGTWRQRVSRVLVVDCPEDMQIRRVSKRNGFDELQVRAIMSAQVPRSVRLAAADDVIVNDRETSALVPQVDRLHALYSTLAKTNARKHAQHL